MQCDINDVLLAYEKYCKYNNSNVLVKGKNGRSFLDYFLHLNLNHWVLSAQSFSKLKYQILMLNLNYSQEKIVNLLSNAPKDFSLDLQSFTYGKKISLSLKKYQFILKKD